MPTVIADGRCQHKFASMFSAINASASPYYDTDSRGKSSLLLEILKVSRGMLAMGEYLSCALTKRSKRFLSRASNSVLLAGHEACLAQRS